MDANSITTPLAAFMAGMVTSVHCSAMCGPLTCAMFSSKQAGISQATVGVYHAARILSYSLIGGTLGAIGASAAGLFSNSFTRALPWAFIGILLIFALGLDKKIPQPRFLAGLLFKLKFSGMKELQLGTMLGLATPFLPCAPLYLVFGVAVFAGSFVAGAKLMAAFALGTLPLYWLLQSQYFRVQKRCSPGAMQWMRQGLAFVSCGLLVWRTVANEGVAITQQVHCIFCR